jgi:hypothetical protein
MPINDETLSAVPVANSMTKTPRSESGAADIIIKAGAKARNWITSTMKTAANARPRTERRSRKELCWLS